MDRDDIRAALARNQGNVSHTAADLSVDRLKLQKGLGDLAPYAADLRREATGQRTGRPKPAPLPPTDFLRRAKVEQAGNATRAAALVGIPRTTFRRALSAARNEKVLLIAGGVGLASLVAYGLWRWWKKRKTAVVAPAGKPPWEL